MDNEDFENKYRPKDEQGRKDKYESLLRKIDKDIPYGLKYSEIPFSKYLDELDKKRRKERKRNLLQDYGVVDPLQHLRNITLTYVDVDGCLLDSKGNRIL